MLRCFLGNMTMKVTKIHHIIGAHFKKFKCIVFHNREENSLHLDYDYELSKKESTA